MTRYTSIHSRFTHLSCVIAVGLIVASFSILLLPYTGTEATGGTRSGAIMRSGFGARALGMGGAYVAVANDYSASYWNPAGVTRANSIYLGGMRYDKYGLGLNMNYLSGGLSLKANNSSGNTSLALSNLPLIKGVSFAGTYQGFSTEVRVLGPGGSEIPVTYGERSFLATGGVSFPLIGSFGITGKNYSYTAPGAGVDGDDASASGMGFDLGYLIEPLENLTLGMAAFDLGGTNINWKNTPTEPTDTIPVRYSAGSAISAHLNRSMVPNFISGDLLVSGQYSFGPEVVNKIRAGVEYSFSIFSLRAGAVKPADSEIYYTAGAGLNLNFVTGDLAWVQNRSLEGENTTDTIVISTEFTF